MLETLTPNGRGCKVVKIWETLDDSDKKIYAEAINNWTAWPSFALERELRKRGVTISNDAISRHRQEMCFCKERPF